MTNKHVSFCPPDNSPLYSSGQEEDYWCVLPAAGIGQRMGGNVPKQYLSLGAMTVLEHTLSILLSIKQLAGIVVVIHPDDQYWSSLPVSQHTNIHTVYGGEKRCDSVLAGLRYLQNILSDRTWILVHDAARPCILAATIELLIDTLKTDDVGGILAVPSKDTLKQLVIHPESSPTIEQTLDRNRVWQAQTPQLFRYHILLSSLTAQLTQGVSVTDEASAVEAMGYRVNIIKGSHDNIKITYPHDLTLAQTILAER